MSTRLFVKMLKRFGNLKIGVGDSDNLTLDAGRNLVLAAGDGYIVDYGTTSGGIKIAPIAVGTALTTIVNQNVAAATITLPNATAELATLGLEETLDLKTLTNAGDVTLATGKSLFVTKGTVRAGGFNTGKATTDAVQLVAGLDIWSDGQLDALSVFAASMTDLGGGYSSKVGRFRHVANGITLNQETYGLIGQMVVKNVTFSHLHAGLMGTLEVDTAATAPASSGSAHAAVGASAVCARIGGATITVAATGKLYGFLALGLATTVSITAGGLYAAYGVDLATGGQAWGYGLYIPNSDAVIGISIGSCTTGIVFPGTQSGGKCIDFDDVTLAAGSTNNIWSYGDSTTKEVTITDYFFPVRMNVTSIANPGAARMAALMYLKFNITTAHHTNLDMQGIGLSMDLAKNIKYAHGLDVYQNISANVTASSGTHCAKFTLNLATSMTLTSHASSCLFAQITGAGTYTPDTARLTILKLHRAANVTAGGSYIHIDNLGTAEFCIDVPSSGSIGHFIHWGNPNGGTGAKTGAYNDAAQNSDGLIKILVGGTTYYIPYYGAGKVTGEW